MDRLRRGKPIVVPGDGTSLWVCCHRDDGAGAFVAAAGNSAALGQACHVTGEEWLTWNQLHRQAAEAIGALAPKLIHIPSELLALAARVTICQENLQFCNIFDNAKARRDLGFRQSVTWSAGVRRMNVAR